MANIHRSEVALKVGDDEYTLKYSTNALCDLEDKLGQSAAEFGERFAQSDVGFKDVRVMLWAGLQDKHPDLTLRQAGDIVDVVGITKVMPVIEAAFSAAFPDMAEKIRAAQGGADGDGEGKAAGSGADS